MNRLSLSVLLMVSLLIFPGSSSVAHAVEEGIGTLELRELFMEPRYSFVEGDGAGTGGAFQLGSSYVAFAWRRDQSISAVMKIGAKRLIGAPSRYASEVAADEIGVVEGYAQLDSLYGRVRAGLIPIPFGLEGGDVERHLRLPRSQAFQTRFLNLRDMGVSYRIAVNGFFSHWAVHNGEGGTDLDREAWFTARWGWENSRNLRLGLSGSTGRTRPLSTDPGGADGSVQTGFKINEPSRLRIANAFFDWAPNPVRLSAEATAGDTFQGESESKFRALHVDFDWRLSDALALLTRYDVMSPRNDVADADVTEYTAGFAWRSRYENSVLYILGTKRAQRNVSPETHQGMVIWRITPLASSFPGVL